MARINTVQPEKATGAIKEGYDMYVNRIGIIPRPMEMLSVSPALFELNLRRVHYFSTHPKLSFSLLAHIRYLVAHQLNYAFCMDFNKYVMKKQGLEEEDISRMEADPTQALLEENEKAMLAFVVKSVKAPGSVTDGEIQKLRELGWEDKDMVDALAQGVSMIDHAIMMEVFQIDQNCMVG
jgi:alkylhydroperoxidase family enzyme